MEYTFTTELAAKIMQRVFPTLKRKQMKLIIYFSLCSLLCGKFLFAFEAQQVAKEEVAAWKDYYDNDVTGLVQHLSHLVIIEFRLNQITAWKTVIPELIAAAEIFKNLAENTSQDVYDSKVLPHLEIAYEAIREALHGQWDPHQAAKDELDWWVYRRQQKTSNPEVVGKKIADLYQLIYGKNDHHHFVRAGYLRAVAARYRDLSQKDWNRIEDDDWIIIENILEQSYKELVLGIEANAKG